MKLAKTLVLISLAGLTLGACSSKQAKVKKYYRLSPHQNVVKNTTIKPHTLVIKRPKALSILGGRPMVATQNDGSLVQLNHNFWLESPKVLLQDKLKSWASSRWQNVSYQTPNDETHQILETRILAFEKKADNAIVALEFMLYNAENKLIYNKKFTVEKPIQGEDFKAFSVALSQALDTLLTQFEAEL